MKPGWKTSEFYITLLSMLVAVALHVGLIDTDQAQQVTQTGSSIIAELFDLILVVVPSAAYIVGRSWVKKSNAE